MRFEKWQALGNDYIIVERDELSVRAHARAGAADVRRPLRRPLRRRAAALAAQRPALRGVAADLQPGRLGGGAAGNGVREAVLYLRRARLDRPATSSRSRRRRARCGPTITSATHVHASRWGARGCSSPDFPSGGDDGRGTVIADGREFAFQHVSIGNPQCVIPIGEGLEELDLVAHRPADRGQRAVPEPHQRVVHPRRVRRPRARADLRARGGGDAGLGHRRVRRGRDGGAARRDEPGDRGRSTAASSRSRSPTTST